MKKLAFKMYLKKGAADAFQTCEHSDSQELGSEEIVQKWWKYMSDIMETNTDNSPKQLDLIPVFNLDH